MSATRKVIRLATIGAVLVACVSAQDARARSQGLIHYEGIYGDHHSRWTMLSLNRIGGKDPATTAPFHPDEVWAAEYLEDPASIYSDLAAPLANTRQRYIPRTGNPAEGFTYAEGTTEHPMITWPRPIRVTADEEGSFPIDAGVNRMIAWNLGLFKALPSDLRWKQQIPYDWIPGDDLGPLSRFSLFKADIGPEVSAKAQSLAGPQLSMLAAELALAVDTLDYWYNNPWWGNDDDSGGREVLERFRAATTLADLTDQDLSYLADVFRMELSVVTLGAIGGRFNGALTIPPALRVARGAAAHHVAQPGYRACLANGKRDPVNAGSVPEDISRPICLSDATDRAVYRWYRATRAHQLAQSPDDFPDFGQAARLIAYFADIRAAWAGAYAEEAAEWSAHAEILEAQALASRPDPDLPIDDAAFLRMVDRANQRICRSRP